jgi:putative transposase
MDAAGRYFASFVVETQADPLPATDAEVGIDLGLTYFAVLADGRKVASPKFLRRAERRLRTAQQTLSRRCNRSANREKARVEAARRHARVADARRPVGAHESGVLGVRGQGRPQTVVRPYLDLRGVRRDA